MEQPGSEFHTLAQFTIAVLEMILYTSGPRNNPGSSKIPLCGGSRPLSQPQMGGALQNIKFLAPNLSVLGVRCQEKEK